MGGDRYAKYNDPLSPVQKRELKHKEHRPDGEKRHLQIISYGHEKLVNILLDDSASVFDKSIAKEEILRRLVREQKRKENYKSKTNKSNRRNPRGQGKSKKEKWKRFEEVAPKTGTHIGSEFQTKYDEFIASGGNLDACPFDINKKNQ